MAAAEEYLVQDLHYECGGRSGQRCADPVSFQTLSRVTGHDATLLKLVPRRSYSFRVCSSRVQGGTEETACSSVETVIILDDPTATPTPTATTPPTPIPEPTPTETPVPTPTPLPLPPAPSLSVTVPPPNGDVHTIDVSWPAIDGVTSYEIAYGPTRGSERSTSIQQSTFLSVAPGCGVTTYFKGRSHGDDIDYAADGGDWSGDHGPHDTDACTPGPVPGPVPTPQPVPPTFTLSVYFGDNNDYITSTETPDWFVTETDTITVRIEGSNLADYTYNITPHPATGFYVDGGSGCGGQNPNWLPNWQTLAGGSLQFKAIRCGIGDVTNLGMEVRARPVGGGDDILVGRTGHVPQAGHRDPRSATYRLDSLSTTHQSTVEPHLDDADDLWDDAIRRSVGRSSYFTEVTENEDVPIGAYLRDVGPQGCPPEALACVRYVIDPANSHFTSAAMWFAFPPRPAAQWTDNRVLAERNPRRIWLPKVALHEFGHVPGIGEMEHGYGVMRQYNRRILTQLPQPDDMRAFVAVDKPHTHPS